MQRRCKCKWPSSSHDIASRKLSWRQYPDEPCWSWMYRRFDRRDRKLYLHWWALIQNLPKARETLDNPECHQVLGLSKRLLGLVWRERLSQTCKRDSCRGFDTWSHSPCKLRRINHCTACTKKRNICTAADRGRLFLCIIQLPLSLDDLLLELELDFYENKAFIPVLEMGVTSDMIAVRSDIRQTEHEHERKWITDPRSKPSVQSNESIYINGVALYVQWYGMVPCMAVEKSSFTALEEEGMLQKEGMAEIRRNFWMK